MKKILLSIAILILIGNSLSSHTEHYVSFNNLEYELFRNNKLIGFHKFALKRNGDELIVESNVEFKIKKLGVDLYNYKAKSSEIYKNNVFLSFSSKTNQNKKEKYVNIQHDKENKELNIDGSSYKGSTSEDFIVGTWWNHEIVKAKAQISAISGRVIYQNVNFIGKEMLTINNKQYNTLRFNFSSSDNSLPPEKKLNTDIWYDEKTLLWVKAAFDKRGYWEYRIKNYN